MNAKTTERKQRTILSLLKDQHETVVKQNKQYLRVIIECLFYTAQQNIALRGHDETHTEFGNQSDTNRGNFLELLNLRCKDISWLKTKLDQQLSKHAQWTSPMIQNEILHIMAQKVIERIVADVKESEKFAIILDETSDISRTEQVALCLTYISKGTKKEAFIGFYETESLEGEALY
jgi:lipoprotein NlpI